MIVELWPFVEQDVVIATASLPSPRKYANLSTQDKAKLAALLGAAPGVIK